jgi:hypothetical protein
LKCEIQEAYNDKEKSCCGDGEDGEENAHFLWWEFVQLKLSTKLNI